MNPECNQFLLFLLGRVARVKGLLVEVQARLLMIGWAPRQLTYMWPLSLFLSSQLSNSPRAGRSFPLGLETFAHATTNVVYLAGNPPTRFSTPLRGQ